MNGVILLEFPLLYDVEMTATATKLPKARGKLGYYLQYFKFEEPCDGYLTLRQRL